MLQENLESTGCLLEKKNKRVEESGVENVRITTQVEELRKIIEELQETHAKVFHEKRRATNGV